MTVYADGSASAPIGTVQDPTFFSGYTTRPPWNVAGVDYAVGVPSGTVLKDWQTLSGPGISVDTATGLVRVNSTSGVVIDGYDFSLHGGAIVEFINSPGGVVKNSKFVNGSLSNAIYTNALISADTNSPGLTVTNNTIDGGTPTYTNGSTLISAGGGGTIVVKYNSLKNSPQHALEILGGTSGNATLDYEYNMIEDIGNGGGVGNHPNLLQWGGVSSTNVRVAYNTVSQPSGSVAAGEGFQFDTYGGGSISNSILEGNTVIYKGLSTSLAGSYIVHGNDTGGTGGTVTDNYIDGTGTYGAWYPGSFTGYTWANNIDITNGKTINSNNTESTAALSPAPPPPPSPPPAPPSPPVSGPNAPRESPAVLKDFGWAQGWGSADDLRVLADVNGDGNSDYVGFGDSATFISYGGTFSGGGGTGPGFTSVVAAVGDGDILYGQGYAGVYWYEATGETAKTDAAGNTYEVLQYQTTPNLYGNFGSQEGWTSDNGFQILKTTSTDTSASILGFGYSGIVVGPDAFATGATAADSYVIPLAVGNSSGWKQSVDIRTFTDQNGKPIDLNGDGIADFVGMGPDGLVYAYGSGSGGSYTLGALKTAHIASGNSDFGEAQGWTDATTVRDIVYDAKTGYDDIIAFGAAGVYVAMGQNPNTHGGEPFGQLYLALADFGSDQGWTVSDTPRLIGDVTGDGTPDIVGFGTNSTYVAVGSRDSSGNLQFKVDTSKTIADFGSAEGWSGSTEQTVRALGTVAGSGSVSSHADLILSGASNTQVWHFT